MALGTDLIFVEECIQLGIPFIAAVPFKGQESRWPDESQNTYHRLLKRAQRVVYVDEDPMYHGDSYGSKLYMRNKWMVDRASIVIAVWNGSSGGTANAVKSAIKRDLKVLRLDPMRRTVAPE